MTASNRAAKLAKLFKVLKKHYQPVKPPSDRSVLEHLLYAACLENANFEAADEAFARLQESYFDWNEVRVTTVNELTESMNCLPNSEEGALRLKTSLHAVFESQYSFDLDFLKKENLGKAVQKLQSFKGVSPFIVSYVIQNGLAGHSIGVDDAAVSLAKSLGLVTDKEAANFQIPGMERAIPKNKGAEFSSLMHQLAVAYHHSKFSPAIRKIILEIDAEAKDRFPKRSAPKAATPKKAAKSKKAAESAGSTKKAPVKKAAAKKEAPKKAPAKKKAAATTKTAKKKVAKKAPAKAARKTTKKSATKSLARKKPR